MTSCHIISTWHKWNMNTADIIMTWFTLYANLVTSPLACVTHMCMHGTHALCRTIMSKYLSGLGCMQVNMNLAKITPSHFWVLNTQNANQNMPNMILITYLKENFTDCNENLAWGNQNPSFIPMCFIQNKR